MRIRQVVRPSAERPAPILTRDVFVRNFDGNEARRIPRAVAEKLVSSRLADIVSRAGHIRLKAGIPLIHDFGIHGLRAVESLRRTIGDNHTARTIEHRDHAIGRWRPPLAF